MSFRFTALTYNLYKLGSPVAPETVLDQVLDLEPDLAGFQEVFNTRLALPFLEPARNARKLLERRLAAAGYVTRWLPTGGLGHWSVLLGGRFQDGLLVAAKGERWELDPERDYLPTILGQHGFDRRGLQCLLVRARAKDGPLLAFCNTHLSAGTDEERRGRRRRQLAAAVEFLRRLETERRPAATLLVGDFNAREGDEIVGALTAPADPADRFEDAWRAVNPPPAEGLTFDRDNTIVARRQAKGTAESSARIDYVFLRPDPGQATGAAPVEIEASQVVLDAPHPAGAPGAENLSDHYGVLTELRLA